MNEDSPQAAVPRIYRGYEKRRLIIDLATGAETDREIARREGLALKDIQAFRQEYERDIAEAQQMLLGKLAEEVAGLWISKKANRLAEYQEQIEEIRATLAAYWDAEVPWSRAQRDLIRAYMELFRMTAEELGAYPQRASAPAQTGKTVHYVIETDDSGALQ